MKNIFKVLFVMSPIFAGLIIFGLLAIYLELCFLNGFDIANRWISNGGYFNKSGNPLPVDFLTNKICVSLGLTVGLWLGYLVVKKVMIGYFGIMTEAELNRYFSKKPK